MSSNNERERGEARVLWDQFKINNREIEGAVVKGLTGGRIRRGDRAGVQAGGRGPCADAGGQHHQGLQEGERIMRLKEIQCRLHTGGKTVAEIKERYTGQGLTYRGFESLQRAFDLFDGQEINLFKRERGGEIVYYVAVWPKENMKIMDAVYEAEQTHPDRRYTDDKQKFMLDWLQGKYSAGMAFEFRAEDVEELGTVAEEANEPDTPPMENAAPPRWRQIRDKKQRRQKGARKL